MTGDNVFCKNCYLLGVKNILSHTHKTETWYVFKISHFVATPFLVPGGVPALEARALSIRLMKCPWANGTGPGCSKAD